MGHVADQTEFNMALEEQGLFNTENMTLTVTVVVLHVALTFKFFNKGLTQLLGSPSHKL